MQPVEAPYIFIGQVRAAVYFLLIGLLIALDSLNNLLIA
jgi:hypothetical protein